MFIEIRDFHKLSESLGTLTSVLSTYQVHCFRINTYKSGVLFMAHRQTK